MSTTTDPAAGSTKPKPRNRRGRGSLLRRSNRYRYAYRERAAARRIWERSVRCPEGQLDAHRQLCKVVPYLHSSSQDARGEVCQCVLDFYHRCGIVNPYVEVRSGLNIANPLGDKPEQQGLFSLQDLEPGLRFCLYSGEVYTSRPSWGAYILEIAKDFYIDAERDTRDIGYLWPLGSQAYLARVPHNHGRYINTVYPSDHAAGWRFNCEFVVDESGLDVVWVQTTRAVAAGEELLADYGKLYLPS